MCFLTVTEIQIQAWRRKLKPFPSAQVLFLGPAWQDSKLGEGVTLLPRATTQQRSWGHPAVQLSWALRLLSGGPVWMPFEAEVHCEHKLVLIQLSHRVCFYRSMGICMCSFSDKSLFSIVFETWIQNLWLSSFPLTSNSYDTSLGVSGVSWPVGSQGACH
jgi:hypothetical protein